MAVDMFLSLDGIDGESADPTHRRQIQIENFTFNIETSGSGGSGHRSRRRYSSIKVIKQVDVATTSIIQALAENRLIREATISTRKAGTDPRDYYKIILRNVHVSAYANLGCPTDGASGLLAPNAGLNEQVDLSFSRISFEYNSQNEDGTLGGNTMFEDEVREPG